MTKRDLASIARFALLSFPGAALGAMLPSEHEAVVKLLTKIMPNLTWTREQYEKQRMMDRRGEFLPVSNPACLPQHAERR